MCVLIFIDILPSVAPETKEWDAKFPDANFWLSQRWLKTRALLQGSVGMKTHQPMRFSRAVCYSKCGCWASSVSLWSDRKTRKRFGLGGRCYETETQIVSFGNPALSLKRNVGRMSTLTEPYWNINQKKYKLLWNHPK